MNLLLDTHVVHWLVDGSVAIRDEVNECLTATESRRYVSSVSAFEVATKVRIGKFERAEPLVQGWAEALRRLGAHQLVLTSEHSLSGGSLEWQHRDPFDRLIAAQAMCEGLTLITKDRAFANVPGLSVLWW